MRRAVVLPQPEGPSERQERLVGNGEVEAHGDREGAEALVTL